MTTEIATTGETTTPEKKARKPRGPRRMPADLFGKVLEATVKRIEAISAKTSRMSGHAALEAATKNLSNGAAYVSEALEELRGIPADTKVKVARAPGVAKGGRPRVEHDLTGKVVSIKSKFSELYVDVFSPEEMAALTVTGNRGKYVTVAAKGGSFFVPRMHVDAPKAEAAPAPSAG